MFAPALTGLMAPARGALTLLAPLVLVLSFRVVAQPTDTSKDVGSARTLVVGMDDGPQREEQPMSPPVSPPVSPGQRQPPAPLPPYCEVLWLPLSFNESAPRQAFSVADDPTGVAARMLGAAYIGGTDGARGVHDEGQLRVQRDVVKAIEAHQGGCVCGE